MSPEKPVPSCGLVEARPSRMHVAAWQGGRDILRDGGRMGSQEEQGPLARPGVSRDSPGVTVGGVTGDLADLAGGGGGLSASEPGGWALTGRWTFETVPRASHVPQGLPGWLPTCRFQAWGHAQLAA